MAARHFKLMRKLLRNRGVDVTHREYRRTRQGPIILAPSCGRAQYHRFKEQARG